MPIESRDLLRMSNTKSAKAAKKREDERRQREREAKNLLAIASIKSEGGYSDKEVELVFQINERVMSADGIAEEWGGYDFNPLDYVSISIGIFEMAKSFYSEQ